MGFFAHHAIADGISCGAFHTTFLNSLNHLISDNSSFTTSPLYQSPSQITLIPNLEEATPLPITIWYALKVLIKTYIYNPVDHLHWTGPRVATSLPVVTTNLRTFSIPQGTVTALVQRCRLHNTTVTSLISVLIARKIAQMHPEASHFTGMIPISMRRFTGLSPSDMGNFVSNVTPSYAFEAKPPHGFISCASPSPNQTNADEDKNLWESARQTREFVARGTASPTNQLVGMLKFVGDYKPFFLGKLGQKRDHAFELTNIGVVDGNVGAAEGKACFDKMTFSTGLCVYGDPFCVSVVTVEGGDMTVAVGWVSGVTEETEARALSAYLEERLEVLGREQE